LKLGADPTIPDRNGLTAFDLATLIEENDTELIRFGLDFKSYLHNYAIIFIGF